HNNHFVGAAVAAHIANAPIGVMSIGVISSSYTFPTSFSISSQSASVTSSNGSTPLSSQFGRSPKNSLAKNKTATLSDESAAVIGEPLAACANNSSNKWDIGLAAAALHMAALAFDGAGSPVFTIGDCPRARASLIEKAHPSQHRAVVHVHHVSTRPNGVDKNCRLGGRDGLSSTVGRV